MASCKITVFQKALLDSVLIEYRDIPEEHELKDRFSEKFHLWADDFIAKQNPQKVRLRRAFRIALIAAALMALLAGTAMAIPAVREAIIDYLFVESEDTNDIKLNPDIVVTAPDIIETAYTVALIPEGYLLAKNLQSRDVISIRWAKGRQMISFAQYTVKGKTDDTNWIGVGNPDDPKRQVLIGEFIVAGIDQKEVYSFLWTNNEYFFLMHIPTDIDWDTMVKIVESVGPAT